MGVPLWTVVLMWDVCGPDQQIRFGPRLGRRPGLGSTECRPDRARITDSSSNKELANCLGPQQCVELGGAHDRLTPTLRCFQGPLAFDGRGAVGAKTGDCRRGLRW